MTIDKKYRVKRIYGIGEYHVTDWYLRLVEGDGYPIWNEQEARGAPMSFIESCLFCQVLALDPQWKGSTFHSVEVPQ